MSSMRNSEKELYKPGDVIGGKYEVHRILGKGSFGIVYLVYVPKLQSVYALKTLRNEFKADVAVKNTFKQEAILWANLEDHPFILAARFVQEISSELLVAMDFVAPDQRGRVSLEDHLLHSRGPLDTKQALEWAIQFCYGMEHAYKHGIKSHNDIKPLNILITQDGTLKIADFGLATAAGRIWRTSPSSIISRWDGRFTYSLVQHKGRKWCGTPGYVAPEVYIGNDPDVRSDIFSFGIVLWQMVNGNILPQFGVDIPCSDDRQKDADRYQNSIYQKQITGWLPAIDGLLKPIIHRCLALNPSGRYEDFRQLRLDLEPIFEQLTSRCVSIPEVGEKTAEFFIVKGASMACLHLYDEAIVCFNKAIEIYPRSNFLYYSRGCAYYGKGDYDLAIADFNKAIEINPGNGDVYSSRGCAYCQKRDYDLAVADFNKAIEIDPGNGNTYSSRGNAYYQKRDFDLAIADHDKAIEIDPRNGDAYYIRGLAYCKKGDYDNAIANYDKAIEINPISADLYNSRGLAYYQKCDYDNAIVNYDKAIEINPRHNNAYYNRGLAYFGICDYDHAIANYDKAIEINPMNADAYYSRGLAYYLKFDYDYATADYNKAIEINPKYNNAYYNRGNAFYTKRSNKHAITEKEKTSEINPRNAVVWYNKVARENNLDKTQETIRSYQRSPESAQPKYDQQIPCIQQQLFNIEKKANKQANQSCKAKAIVFNRSGNIETQNIDFIRGEILVGRKDPENPDFQPSLDLRDLRMNPKHVSIRREGNKYFIKDLDSKNGTLVEGREIKGCGAVEFVPGTPVKTGDTTWTFVPDEWLFILSGKVMICGPCSTTLNYAQYRCGMSLFGSLTARNLGTQSSPPFNITLQIANYSDPCEINIPALEAGSRQIADVPVIRLNVETLQRQIEPIETSLFVLVNGKDDQQAKKQLTVLGLWDWSLDEYSRRTLATFVLPRNQLVERIVLEAESYIKDLGDVNSFRELLRSGHSDTELLIVKSIYKYLKEKRHIFYKNPSLNKNYQSIYPPHSIFNSTTGLEGHGTCLDLVLLTAACLENVGLYPLVILTGIQNGCPRHALAGCWVGPSPCIRPLIHSAERLKREVASGNLILVECLGFAEGARVNPGKLRFNEAVAEAIRVLESTKWVCAVDIRALRPPYGNITPIESPFEPVVECAFHEAEQLAKAKGHNVETTFLFYGLLSACGQVTKWLLSQVGLDIEKKTIELAGKIVQGNERGKLKYTDHALDCKRRAEDLAWQTSVPSVREQDLLWAMIMEAANSHAFPEYCREISVDLTQLSNILEKKYPRPKAIDSISFLSVSLRE